MTAGPFVYELIFRGNATSATAAAKEVLAATDALAAETQGAAAATGQDTAATIQNATAKRAAALASREAAAAAETEARAREALRKATTSIDSFTAPLPTPVPAPTPAPVPTPAPPVVPPVPNPVPASPAAGSGAAAAYSANLMYQWNDIAMMAMAGQNPMMLMMQQGTQVTQTFAGLRASGLSVGTALRASFMGMLNPMSLATMAVIGFGTAAVQWLMDSGEQAKSLDEALGDLEKSTSAVDRAMKEARKGTSELSGDFGNDAKAARELNLALLGLAQMQAAQDVKKSITAVSEALADMHSWLNFGVIDDRTLEKKFNLTARSAAEVGAAIQQYQFAETNEDRIAAAQGIAEALERAQYGSEGATDAAILFGQEVGKTALLAKIFKGQTEERAALEKELAKTDIGAPYRTAAEKAKELKDLTGDVMKALKDTRAPYDLADDLKMTQRIAEATAQYGADSLEVKRLQIEAERQDFEAKLRDMTQLTEAHKQQLRDLWESSKGLSGADPFGLVAAGRELYRAQAQTVGQLQLELSLVGQSETVRRRVLAIYQAEMDIRTAGIDRDSDRARQILQQAELSSDLQAQLDRVADAWDTVQKAGENAIDGIFDALKKGDVGGAFENLASELGSMFEELAITNPLKNAIFGTDYATMGDVGGLKGIWDRYTGKAGPLDAKSLAATAAAQTVASMNVTAATVIIGGAGVGGLAGGIGAGGGMGGLQGSADVQKQVWSFFSSKGLKPHQVAAIMGNVQGESSFNPLAGGDIKNGVPTSFGLFQHHGPRADGLMASLGGRQNLGNVQGQLEYAWRELNTTHSGALAALKAAPDVSSATNAWMRQFERPSDEAMQKSWSNRLGAAEQAMAKFGTTTTLATGQLGTMGTGFDKFGQALGSAVQGGGGGGFWGTLFSSVMSGLGIPGFAGGGQHGGGLRIVGENGPELEYTGPSTIVPADLTRRILSGGAPTASAAQIDARPVININNQSSVPVQGEVQEVTDARGQRRYELVMADAVASGLTAGGGKARRTMRDYYGVNPVGIAR
ncbi:phage tail tip lysozyme [Rhodobacter capsulatus]|uniref:phage tail tip lysozyme n=1 Tax=Rhodobacter capsulatus TaxID=1061 RepID=UPI0040277F7C